MPQSLHSFSFVFGSMDRDQQRRESVLDGASRYECSNHAYKLPSLACEEPPQQFLLSRFAPAILAQQAVPLQGAPFPDLCHPPASNPRGAGEDRLPQEQ